MRIVRRVAVGLLVMVLLAAGTAYLNRTRLQVWHALRGLGKADEAGRGEWIDRVAALGDSALDSLCDCLGGGDDRAADNALAALDHLARVNGPGHAATGDLVVRLADRFPVFSAGRQVLVLMHVRDWLTGGAPVDPFPEAACRLIADGGSRPDAEVQAAALDLACQLVKQPGGDVSLALARDLARAGLRSPSSAVRQNAVRVCLAPGVALLDQLVGLLRDPCPDVRRAAILALGPAEEIVGEEGILLGLHDSDPEVRRLTEVALKGRGLKPEHIELGRLLTHPRPDERLHVLDHIAAAIRGRGTAEVDIDPGVWLRRLSHDPSPSVRVGALRLMGQQKLIDLSDRIDQMARTDSSPTVCQLARFYLAGQGHDKVTR